MIEKFSPPWYARRLANWFWAPWLVIVVGLSAYLFSAVDRGPGLENFVLFLILVVVVGAFLATVFWGPVYRLVIVPLSRIESPAARAARESREEQAERDRLTALRRAVLRAYRDYSGNPRAMPPEETIVQLMQRVEEQQAAQHQFERQQDTLATATAIVIASLWSMHGGL